MKLLPYWSLTGKNPAFYDTESATAIEQTAKVYGAMQTLIKEYNEYVSTLNKEIDTFETDMSNDMDCFRKCITETVSNYIQAIDMRMDTAESFMKSNIEDTTQDLMNEAIRIGAITIVEVYDETTESLNLVVTGEV